MFEYLKTLNNGLEATIWGALILIIIALAGAVIYKILTAEKIKAGPVEIENIENAVIIQNEEKKEIELPADPAPMPAKRRSKKSKAKG